MVIRRHEYAIYIVIYGDEQERIINTDSLVYNKESHRLIHTTAHDTTPVIAQKSTAVYQHMTTNRHHMQQIKHTHTHIMA